MAIAITNHATLRSTADTASYDTASFSPGTNRLLVACYESSLISNDPNTPTIDAAGDFGLTWTNISTHFCTTDDTAEMRRTKMVIFAADTGAAPGTDFLRFIHSGGQAQVGAGWSVFEVTGTDLASGGGSSTVAQCFVQVVTTAVNPTAGTGTGDLTLASPGHANNRPFFWVMMGATEAITHRTNWTEIGEDGDFGPNQQVESQWRSDTFETTASATWTSSVRFGGIAFEIKALAAGGGTTVLDPMGMTGFFGA